MPGKRICYGPATIEAVMDQTPYRQLPAARRFWLSNAAGYPTETAHPPHSPSAERLIAESLCPT